MRKQILCFLLISTPLFSLAQTDSVKTYLTTALGIMKNKSVNKAKVNWDSLYRAAYNAAKDAKTIKDTYPIISSSLKSLNDSHSGFYPAEMVRVYTLGYRATGQEFPVIKSELLKNNYAYINLPDIGSFNNADWNEYVDTFYEKVNALQKQKPKGWIIDLRENFGGMLYPMYAAITTFLDRKNVVGNKDAEGKIEYFNYQNGNFYEGSTIMQRFQLKQPEPKKTKSPVVIWVSKTTASSGEFITAAFVGQKNTLIIGTNTQGLTSGNQEYRLTDGSFLKLTTGNTVDRNGKEYAQVGEGIAPPILIKKTADPKETDQLYLTEAFRFIDTYKK